MTPLIFLARVEGVTDTVAHEGERDNDNDKHQARPEFLRPGGGRVDSRGRVRDHQPQAGSRWLQSGSEQANACLTDDRAENIERGGDDDDGEQVRHDVLRQNIRRTGANGTSSLDKLALLQLERLS